MQRVAAKIDAERLIEPGASVLVGVSGGPDSMALLDLLHGLAPARTWRLAVAHLHHGLRGAEADADLDLARRAAAERNLSFLAGNADVRALAARAGLSLELAGRRARLSFFARLALEHGFQIVALGHHRDDQAETVLLRLLRGAGARGLAGMRASRPLEPADGGSFDRPAAEQVRLVRPLLAFSKAELERYCRERGLAYRIDATNRDPAHLRNRVRHELLPLLAELAGSDLAPRLARLAEMAAADEAALEAWALRALSESAPRLAVDGSWRLRRPALASCPEAVVRRTLRQMAQRLGVYNLDHDDLAWLSARALGAQDGGPERNLPGGLGIARVGSDELAFWRLADPEWAPVESGLPGSVGTPLGKIEMALEPRVALAERPAPHRLWVRRPARGETVSVPGRGTARIGEWLRRAGVPKGLRFALPLVADESGPIWHPVLGPVAPVTGSRTGLAAPSAAEASDVNFEQSAFAGKAGVRFNWRPGAFHCSTGSRVLQ